MKAMGNNIHSSVSSTVFFDFLISIFDNLHKMEFKSLQAKSNQKEVQILQPTDYPF